MAMVMTVVGTAEELVSDVATMGPWARQIMARATGRDRPDAMREILGGLTRLGTALGGQRRAYLEERIAASPKTGTAPRFQLGSGPNRLDGWINIDLYPAELALNLRWGLPFETGSVSFVFLGQYFEHLYKGKVAPRLLKEIHRVLRPNGVVRIIFPDAEFYMRAYVEDDDASFEMQRRVWHNWAPKTGFEYVERSAFMASSHPELRVDDATTVADAQVDGRHVSLVVEARK